MAECLTPIEIERFLADSLPPEDKVRAEAHLAEAYDYNMHDHTSIVDGLHVRYPISLYRKRTFQGTLTTSGLFDCVTAEEWLSVEDRVVRQFGT